jgi:hypothetical protein
MTVIDAMTAGLLDIPDLLDLAVGFAPSQDSRYLRWGTYTDALRLYGRIRADMLSRPTGMASLGERPRHFAEVLYRVARRWPLRDVEQLGAAIYERRYGNDSAHGPCRHGDARHPV